MEKGTRERSRSPAFAPASAALTFPGGQLLDESRPDDTSTNANVYFPSTAALTFSGDRLVPESQAEEGSSQAVLTLSGGPSVEDDISETSRPRSPALPSIVTKLSFLRRLLKLLQTDRVCLHCGSRYHSFKNCISRAADDLRLHLLITQFQLLLAKLENEAVRSGDVATASQSAEEDFSWEALMPCLIEDSFCLLCGDSSHWRGFCSRSMEKKGFEIAHLHLQALVNRPNRLL